MSATEKQFAFIKKLLDQKNLTLKMTSRVTLARESAMRGELSVAQASQLISDLKDLSNKTTHRKAVAPVEEMQAGIYQNEGTIFRVYFGQNSGHMLVKMVEVEDGEATYEYLGAASRVFNGLNPVRLPLSEVGKLGIASGSCLICGRALDDPESVDRGIGPVCAEKY